MDSVEVEASRGRGSEHLKKWIRDVPDFPKPGILFRDITPLLGHSLAFREVVEHMAASVVRLKADVVVGIEARGFLFAGALGDRLGLPIAPVRKPGKLPWRSVSETYDLEYGQDSLHLHEDAFASGARVVIVDDVLATGGTAAAVSRLVTRAGGEVAGFAFAIELVFLEGRQRLGRSAVDVVLQY